jgi:hypothetical protein
MDEDHLPNLSSTNCINSHHPHSTVPPSRRSSLIQPLQQPEEFHSQFSEAEFQQQLEQAGYKIPPRKELENNLSFKFK